MFRPIADSHRRPHRRGTSFVLIVVVMLSVFAVVGTGYALLAIRENKVSLIRKDEQNGGLAAPDPTDTVNAFFGTLIYDTGDSGNSLFNGLRGHSIGRSMYGYDSLNPATAANPYTTPWNGVGLFREDAADAPPPPPPGIPVPYAGYGLTAGTDRAQFVNYNLVMVNGKPMLLDPERMGHRGATANNPLPIPGQNNPNYVSKAAPYSYPDLKDFFAGVVDPNTGAVLVSSFHREWLFGPLDPLNGQTAGATYNAANNNWLNGPGRMKTLRPRPAEHPQFPRVPPNADGTYTGDVQNWPGGFTYALDPTSPAAAPVYRFYGRNDSLWMDLGLPVLTLPGNRKVQPMVAPLIVPIDGQLNASAHGNAYGSGGTTHVSYAGYGAWEVNLAAALTNADATKVIAARRTPIQQRNTNSSRAYAPSYAAPLPSYAPVPWTANTAPPASLTYPTSNSMTGLPTFTGFDTSNTPMGSHPSLFNPTEWPGDGSATLRTFPLTDIKRLNRFGFTPHWYAQAAVASVPPAAGLLGDQTNYPFNFAPGQTSAPADNYRLDPAHPTRGLVTPHSYSLDRPMVAPSFLAGGLMVPAPGAKPINPSAGQLYPAPGANPGPGGDFARKDRWYNIQAALGSVNLNRPLTDYRDLTKAPNVTVVMGNQTATPQPLSMGNMANAAQADSDRQQLARDIFVRLAVATGGALITNPSAAYPAYSYSLAPTATPGSPQYDALRYLAQLAANIVDYIDNDDISTAFVWNPTPSVPGVPPDVVYGVEKPRLVINEAYAEITNDPADPVDGLRPVGMPQEKPKRPAQVRFWLELLNPTAKLPASPTSNGPLGTGTVSLDAYQIMIRRDMRQSVLAGAADTMPQYQAQILKSSNTTGTFTDPEVLFPLAGAAIPSVDPNDGGVNPLAYNPTTAVPATLPANGFVLVGPQVTAKGDEFAPDPAGGVWTPGNFIQAPLTYQFPLPGGMAPGKALAGAEFKRHVVLLQRKANPYAAINDPATPAYNPMLPANAFITVDLMDYVPAFDAVHRGKDDGANRGASDRAAMPKKNPDGYDPVDNTDPTFNRFSVGKVQPYAGHSFATVQSVAGGYNKYPVLADAANPGQGSMVVPQNPPVPNPAPMPGIPQHTFGRHNGKATALPAASTVVPGTPQTLTDTIMLPFDWYVHMDRPLVNQIELFQVRDTPPHRVTDLFIFPGGNSIDFERGFANWTSASSTMTRALEYLSVKPWTAGVPHGGRVAGKIAINAVQNQKVVTALFDPQAGNGFDPNYVSNTAWTQWLGTRSTMQPRTMADSVTQFVGPVPNSRVNTAAPANPPFLPAPSQTDDSTNDMGGAPVGVDRPFYSFGVPVAAPSPGGFAYGTGGSNELTILRQGAGKPMLYADENSKGGTPLGYSASQPHGPSYTQAEPLRKIFNNTTPVSHNYLVYLTVGYFDVVNENPNPPAGWPSGVKTRPLLGAEAYIAVPGDMRAKFVAVIDMSNMTTAPGPTPYFTSLENNVYPPTNMAGVIDPTLPVTLNIAYSSYSPANPNQFLVAADGQDVVVTAGSTLYLGYGAEQQIVTVQQILGPGQAQVTGLGRPAWGGSCVSNVQPGYPGPQPVFAYTSPAYKAVLPYVERLR